MIHSGNKRIGRFILDKKNVPEIYAGPKLVWGREVELLQMFKASVLADGGIYDEELFTTEFFRQSALVRSEAAVLIVCGAYKAGIIYGINCITGQAVPFTFGRTSVGTYIDKYGKLQSVGANIPRIDYDPVGLGLRGYLFENGVTQLIQNTLLNGNINTWSPAEIAPTYNTGITESGRSFITIAKTSSSGSRSLNSSPFLSASNTTYAARVILRAGTSNKVDIGIGVMADPGGSNTIWGGVSHTAGRILSGPGTIYNSSGLMVIEGLTSNQDTIVEISRKYYTSGLTLSLFLYPGRAPSTTIGDSIQFSTPQMEINALGVCTSQMDSSNGQMTRSLDTLYGSGSLIRDEGCTVFMEGSRLSSGVSGSWMFSRSANARVWYTSGGTHGVSMYDGITVINAANQVNGETIKVAASVGPEGQKINRNATLVKGSYNGTFGSGNIYIAGSEGSGMVGRIQNHLRSFAIIHRQLSDAEHIALTT